VSLRSRARLLRRTLCPYTTLFRSIVTRGLAAGRTPWGNMYEYSVLLAALVVVGYLLGVELRAKIRTLGGFVYAFVVFTMAMAVRSEEHTSELQSRVDLVCRLLLEI